MDSTMANVLQIRLGTSPGQWQVPTGRIRRDTCKTRDPWIPVPATQVMRWSQVGGWYLHAYQQVPAVPILNKYIQCISNINIKILMINLSDYCIFMTTNSHNV